MNDRQSQWVANYSRYIGSTEITAREGMPHRPTTPKEWPGLDPAICGYAVTNCTPKTAIGLVSGWRA
jgi:hypothetical protein